jgi:hypothetical protein
MPTISVGEAFGLVHDDVAKLLAVSPELLGRANPPKVCGVYMLLVGDEIMYVGKANGLKGLRDRLLSKHISGDDKHAIQRAFKADFPDRALRREHIKKTVLARWVSIADPARASTVEQLLIWLCDPPWNRA